MVFAASFGARCARLGSRGGSFRAPRVVRLVRSCRRRRRRHRVGDGTGGGRGASYRASADAVGGCTGGGGGRRARLPAGGGGARRHARAREGRVVGRRAAAAARGRVEGGGDPGRSAARGRARRVRRAAIPRARDREPPRGASEGARREHRRRESRRSAACHATNRRDASLADYRTRRAPSARARRAMGSRRASGLFRSRASAASVSRPISAAVPTRRERLGSYRRRADDNRHAGASSLETSQHRSDGGWLAGFVVWSEENLIFFRMVGSLKFPPPTWRATLRGWQFSSKTADDLRTARGGNLVSLPSVARRLLMASLTVTTASLRVSAARSRYARLSLATFDATRPARAFLVSPSLATSPRLPADGSAHARLRTRSQARRLRRSPHPRARPRAPLPALDRRPRRRRRREGEGRGGHPRGSRGGRHG